MSTQSDERIIATQQRWAARGMWMLSIALAIDVLVRILILKQEPRQYMDISLILLATMLYVSFGATASGVEPFGGKWSKTWLLILLVAVTITAVLTLMGMVPRLANLIGVIVSGAAGAFTSLVILRGIYRVWERKTLGRAPREE